MNILSINYDFYLFPTGQSDLDVFMESVETSTKQFIPLVRLLDEDCVAPYFIDSHVARTYLNKASLEHITTTEATILPRAEYDRQLAQCVLKTCQDCVHYRVDDRICELVTHRDKLRLDGVCYYKETFTGEEEIKPLF